MKARKEHWEKIYATKQPNEVSWTREVPKISLDFVHSFNLPKSAAIIDIGGGESKLVDYLLDEGYGNITVLDISEKALLRAKQRLGNRGTKVNWIITDITAFHPSTTYDLWHDRATFHFLRTPKQIESYLTKARQAVKGFMIIGTFSDQGPKNAAAFMFTSTMNKIYRNSYQRVLKSKVHNRRPHNSFPYLTELFILQFYKNRKYNSKPYFAREVNIALYLNRTLNLSL